MSLRIKEKYLFLAHETSPELTFPLPLCLVFFCYPVTHSTPAMIVFLVFFTLGECTPALEHVSWLFLQMSDSLLSSLSSCLLSKASFIIPLSPLHQWYIPFSVLFFFTALFTNMLHICIMDLLYILLHWNIRSMRTGIGISFVVCCCIPSTQHLANIHVQYVGVSQSVVPWLLVS